MTGRSGVPERRIVNDGVGTKISRPAPSYGVTACARPPMVTVQSEARAEPDISINVSPTDIESVATRIESP